MVTRMLEQAIEIEGLLRIIRDGSPMPETYELLNRKAAEIAGMAARLAEEGGTPTSETPDADFVMASPEQTLTKQEVVMTEDLALEEEDDILLSFEDIEEENPEETTDEQSAEKEGEADDNRDKAAAERKVQKKQRTKLKAVFSLNDRFLYARELFEGSMKMFDSTLDFLEGLDDFSVIEEYFYNELEWNREDSNVISFMERIRPIFS
ncbi:MAG: hypothetical protein K2N09_07040 [Muribaculaceae bacterium]|nr:hypothetical protein [Muribaculaceae bacterium]